MTTDESWMGYVGVALIALTLVLFVVGWRWRKWAKTGGSE